MTKEFYGLIYLHTRFKTSEGTATAFMVKGQELEEGYALTQYIPVGQLLGKSGEEAYEQVSSLEGLYQLFLAKDQVKFAWNLKRYVKEPKKSIEDIVADEHTQPTQTPLPKRAIATYGVEVARSQANYVEHSPPPIDDLPPPDDLTFEDDDEPFKATDLFDTTGLAYSIQLPNQGIEPSTEGERLDGFLRGLEQEPSPNDD